MSRNGLPAFYSRSQRDTSIKRSIQRPVCVPLPRIIRLSAGKQDWISERYIDVSDHSLETPVCWLRPLSFLSLLSASIQLDVFHDRQRIRFSLSGESLRSPHLQSSFQIELKSGSKFSKPVKNSKSVSRNNQPVSKSVSSASNNSQSESNNNQSESNTPPTPNNSTATITIEVIPPPELSPPAEPLSDNRIPVCVRSSSLPLPHSTMTLVVTEEGFSYYRKKTFNLLIPYATIETLDVKSMDEVDLFFNRPDCAWSHYLRMAIQCSSDSSLWKLLRTPQLIEAKGFHFVVPSLGIDV